MEGTLKRMVDTSKEIDACTKRIEAILMRMEKRSEERKNALELCSNSVQEAIDAIVRAK